MIRSDLRKNSIISSLKQLLICQKREKRRGFDQRCCPIVEIYNSWHINVKNVYQIVKWSLIYTIIDIFYMEQKRARKSAWLYRQRTTISDIKSELLQNWIFQFYTTGQKSIWGRYRVQVIAMYGQQQNFARCAPHKCKNSRSSFIYGTSHIQCINNREREICEV